MTGQVAGGHSRPRGTGRTGGTGRPARSSEDTQAQSQDAAVRADWERRIYVRHSGDEDGLVLPAVSGLAAIPGAGHVSLTWEPVPGAAGYLIERTGGDGKAEILRHGGSDVPAVVGPPFADTGLADGTEYRYRVGAVAGADDDIASWSAPVRAVASGAIESGTIESGTIESGTVASGAVASGEVRIVVDASRACGKLDRVWWLIGSERLSQLRLGPDGPDGVIATEFAEALRIARDDLGVTTVRAHAILHDDNAVVRRDSGGTLRFDFTAIDAIYDQLLALGLRPVVELSFMPAALARDPEQTVFTYRGIISPPADWSEWGALVSAVTSHLVERYGIDEVSRWAFEVWNEPNLIVFWPGTRAEYMRLYDEAARAIKAVDPRLRVGGPATAAAEWIESLAVHAAETGMPLDFASTHTYGNLPLDFRPALGRHGFADTPIWWTEWGVGATHFGPVHDGAMGAPFVLSGFLSAQRRLDAVAYWVVSDHFEELGRPQRLFHNGFGLLTIGNLRKPRYWAAHLAAHLGDEVLAARLDGDGAGTLVQAWATRHDDGTVDVLAWNGTINAALAAGDPRLNRRVGLTVTGLVAGHYQAKLARVDDHHSNITASCPAETSWPDEHLWARLRAEDRLYEEQLPDVVPDSGAAQFAFDLPMPGVARIRLTAGS
jgi:xylan 1,4-beta-xylosidase